MRSWIALLGLLAACGFSSSQSGDAGGGGDGGNSDVLPDAPERCYGTFPKICFTSADAVPTAPRQIPSGGVFEVLTSSFDVCDNHNEQSGEFCVIAGAGFTLPANTTIRAFGTKPLVLLSTKEIVLDGNIDVSSTRGNSATTIGAGGNSASCPPLTPIEGDSGGYGGSFHGPGGQGGQVGTGNRPTAPAALATFPATLRGGCRGADGAKDSVSLPAVVGAGGNGGGAVSVIGTSITINGQINASGGGGGGGTATRSGGGGGGSGGMIVLDTAMAFLGSGVLYANGGGGGEGGASAPNVSIGVDGQVSTGPGQPGVGGASNADGGNGGSGSSSNVLPGAPDSGQVQNAGGGGAGGGGAGFTHAPGIMGNVIAPPSLDLPSPSQ